MGTCCHSACACDDHPCEGRGFHESLIVLPEAVQRGFSVREDAHPRGVRTTIRRVSRERRSPGEGRGNVRSVGGGNSGEGLKPAGGIRMEGHVRKRGHVNPAFQPRFFVLTDDELRYYKTEDTSCAAQGGMRCLDIAAVQASPASVDGTFEFTVTDTSGRNLVCSVPTEESQQAWIESLVAASRGCRARRGSPGGSPARARSPTRGSVADMAKRAVSPARLATKLQQMVESLHPAAEVEGEMSFEEYMGAKCEHHTIRRKCKVWGLGMIETFNATALRPSQLVSSQCCLCFLAGFELTPSDMRSHRILNGI